MSKTKLLLCLMLLGGLLLTACTPDPEPAEPLVPSSQEDDSSSAAGDPVLSESGRSAEGDVPMAMALTSPSFNHGEPIPAQFTCDGEDVSPDLDWFGAPGETVSLALIMDDPDAPGGTWVHWVLYNLPFDLSGLRQGMTDVGQDGLNSWNEGGYRGPCPPSGTHRYFFKLFALDVELSLGPGADKESLLEAMDGHIIGQAELMGTYSH